MKELFEKTNFILDGGVLVLLSEYLAGRTSRGLIARPEGNGLAVLDAFGTPMKTIQISAKRISTSVHSVVCSRTKRATTW